MTEPKRMAALLSTNATTEPSANSKRSKIGTILQALYNGKTLNRFDAERYSDHTLPSTVAAIQSHGIEVARITEAVPCLGGSATAHVRRYWLDATPRNLQKARTLLNQWAGIQQKQLA